MQYLHSSLFLNKKKYQQRCEYIKKQLIKLISKIDLYSVNINIYTIIMAN